jgi:hypothetical protein
MPTAEWTIMIFLNGDSNLEPFSLTDFREIAKIGSTEKFNIVAQFCSPPRTVFQNSGVLLM